MNIDQMTPPQFWEKMDSPLFQVYWERFMEYHNKGEHMQAGMVLRDYKIALDNSKNSYDAWGVCFALISEESKDYKDKFKEMPNDADIKEKLEEYNKHGLTAQQVKENVLAFMKASPEVFTDHLTLYAIQGMMQETQS